MSKQEFGTSEGDSMSLRIMAAVVSAALLLPTVGSAATMIDLERTQVGKKTWVYTPNPNVILPGGFDGETRHYETSVLDTRKLKRLKMDLMFGPESGQLDVQFAGKGRNKKIKLTALMEMITPGVGSAAFYVGERLLGTVSSDGVLTQLETFKVLKKRREEVTTLSILWNTTGDASLSLDGDVTDVPLPASAALMLAALAGFGVVRKRKSL